MKGKGSNLKTRRSEKNKTWDGMGQIKIKVLKASRIKKQKVDDERGRHGAEKGGT